MEIISKKNKYFDVDLRLNEAEIQTIISVFEQNCFIMNRPFEDMKGLRQEIYEKLKELIDSSHQ